MIVATPWWSLAGGPWLEDTISLCLHKSQRNQDYATIQDMLIKSCYLAKSLTSTVTLFLIVFGLLGCLRGVMFHVMFNFVLEPKHSKPEPSTKRNLQQSIALFSF